MTSSAGDRPIRLRPHHLLCVLTYAGEGYTEEFARAFDAIAERLSAGESFVVVDGPDDVCAHLTGPDRHCENASVAARDLLARAQVAIDGDVFTGASIAELRAAFAAGTIRAACTGCSWHALCSGIAGDGFRDPRLRLRASTGSA